nr:competence protein ComK [Mammaliicoccus sciuri]
MPDFSTAVTSTYFFCTGSERSIDNTWINILYVKDFKEYNGNKTKIFLEQDQSLVFPISYHVINHQYLNCLCLYYRNHRNNIFIKQLNTPNIDLTQDGYSVLDVIKMYLKNQH